MSPPPLSRIIFLIQKFISYMFYVYKFISYFFFRKLMIKYECFIEDLKLSKIKCYLKLVGGGDTFYKRRKINFDTKTKNSIYRVQDDTFLSS